jgi:hypothetical protein
MERKISEVPNNLGKKKLVQKKEANEMERKKDNEKE